MKHTATYSPEDNKLRLYPAHRLDKDEYARIKAAGFSWAPKQELFVAPAWSPEREDALLEFVEEIEDEDKSLVERAEERADRFDEYSERRLEDAKSAQAGVERITQGIPMGQPILVGHHSERHARKDAERIENGMRKSVKMWETSKYWEQRAAGAIHAAKYKELPAVRARRIKKIEADLRGVERGKAELEERLAQWSKPNLTHEEAVGLANFSHILMPRKEGDRPDFNGRPSIYDALTNGHPTLYAPRTLDEVVNRVVSGAKNTIPHYQRWIDHFTNRLAYERAMLAEAGGLVSDRVKFAVGGQVLSRGSWYIIVRVNAESVSVAGHFAATITFDKIKDYRPPTEADAQAVKKAMKLPPICNYPGEGFLHLTKAELDAQVCRQWSDFPKVGVIKENDKHGRHRVQQARVEGQKGYYTKPVPVYITDQKRKDPPPPQERPKLPAPEPPPAREFVSSVKAADPEGDLFAAMKDTLREGIKVVSAPQLFPTPHGLAARMIEEARIEPGNRVLEPSAGTGRLLDPLFNAEGTGSLFDPDNSRPVGLLHAVEVNPDLAKNLRTTYVCAEVHTADFLSLNGSLGTFDRIVMNPPFANAADVKHIKHAWDHLAPGGRLVALCANGPRQREALMPLVEEHGGTWEDLPEGSFSESGTNVRVALIVLDKG